MSKLVVELIQLDDARIGDAHRYEERPATLEVEGGTAFVGNGGELTVYNSAHQQLVTYSARAWESFRTVAS